MAQDVIKFPVNVELGKLYVVPCVKNLKGKYVPINSYLHEDKKIIGVDFKHWHIDWRFVSNDFWESEVGWWHNNTTKTKSHREGGIPMVLRESSFDKNGNYYAENTTTTRALNQNIMKTVQWDKNKFKPCNLTTSWESEK